MGFFLGDRDISMINPISSSALARAAFGLFWFWLLKFTVVESHGKHFQDVFFYFWGFSPIFVRLKLTCLVTLFDLKLLFFKNSSD